MSFIVVSCFTSMIVVGGLVGLNAIYQYDDAKSQMTSDAIPCQSQHGVLPPGKWKCRYRYFFSGSRLGFFHIECRTSGADCNNE